MDTFNDFTSALDYLKPNAPRHRYASIADFLALLPRKFPTPRREGKSTSGSDSFSGGFSYDQALSTFKRDPSSVRKFTEAEALLTGGDSGLAIVHDVTGDALDIGRFMSGEPECFASLTDGTPRGRRVRILFDLARPASVDADKLLASQKRLVRLVDWLESQSVRVAVVGIMSNTVMHFEVSAKEYHEPLDLNAIAVMAHPAFFRRLMFRPMEYSPTWTFGYGMADKLRGVVTMNPKLIKSDELSEITVYCGDRLYSVEQIDHAFDTLETKLADALPEPNAEILTVLA